MPIIVGCILGFVASKVLFVGSWLTLIPWGIAGLGIGLYTISKKEALINGAIYGFVLSLVFLISGYNGTRPLMSVLPFFVLLSLFGALSGLILGLIGYFLRRFFRKEK